MVFTIGNRLSTVKDQKPWLTINHEAMEVVWSTVPSMVQWRCVCVSMTTHIVLILLSQLATLARDISMIIGHTSSMDMPSRHDQEMVFWKLPNIRYLEPHQKAEWPPTFIFFPPRSCWPLGLVQTWVTHRTGDFRVMTWVYWDPSAACPQESTKSWRETKEAGRQTEKNWQKWKKTNKQRANNREHSTPNNNRYWEGWLAWSCGLYCHVDEVVLLVLPSQEEQEKLRREQQKEESRLRAIEQSEKDKQQAQQKKQEPSGENSRSQQVFADEFHM